MNGAWMAAFPTVEACFGQERLSDHTSILIELVQGAPRVRTQFRYLNMWSQHESFLAQVKRVWERHVTGTKQFAVMRKLQFLQPVLRASHRQNFLDVIKKSRKYDLLYYKRKIP